jgi:2-oxoglutarate dehydrogenase E1 component
MKTSIKDLQRTSALYGSNATFVEDLYDRYLSDPESVSDTWRTYFDSLDGAGAARPGLLHPSKLRPSPRPAPGMHAADTHAASLTSAAASKQAAVLRLINAYRFRGHQNADLDPLHLRERVPLAELDPAFHGLGDADLDTTFNTGSLVGARELPLREILRRLRRVYCGTIGPEYMHIVDTEQKRWLQDRIERGWLETQLEPDARLRIFERVIAAEGLERYLHSRYVGQKRFSLEGGEALIPALDELIQRAGRGSVREIVMGMAHRGRINVLVNILGKSPAELFMEFEGANVNGRTGSGDVKYHLGYSSDVRADSGNVHLALAFNPSHLEIINPVVEGSVKARQMRRGDLEGNEVLAVVMHGDAAFSGQGVVMETLNMSLARGFTTGGTVHIIINNQIGFTTSNPLDARSTVYCTDVAKMVEAPILHVNGDDPEAVVFVTQVALDFRMRFHKDVIIDLVCYRRHGHNEADEPAVTQPVMYRKIKEHETLVSLYGQRLAEDGLVSEQDVEERVEEYRTCVDKGEVVARNITVGETNKFTVDWSRFRKSRWIANADTAVPVARLQALAEKMQSLPKGFELHPRVAKIVDDRRKMAAGALRMDWGFAETLAYATLLDEGYWIRLTGQDSGRGTFFHRHAVLHNQKDGSMFRPLQNVAPDPGRFTVIDSLLSEEAVLGYELGYATAEPMALVIWEAQFGDFANGAQVVIDQFLSSAEAKWDRFTGLVMFLPHGYEGQGPEHSSARLERYLQLCAEYNLQVCVPTTPAQMFHMLRRQMLRPLRKPLIVLTPKSLLRHRLSTSTLEDLSERRFLTVIDEIDPVPVERVRRVVLCTGKVYYDLLDQRRTSESQHAAIVRVEQLYPFPRESLSKALSRYPNATQVVWCQEEPKNMGCWYQSQHHFRACMLPGQTLHYAGRPASASPAAGYYALHVEQQKTLVNKALEGRFKKEEASVGELKTATK